MTRPPRYSQKFQLPILNQQLNSRNVETNDTAKQAAKDLNTKNYFTLADDLLHEQSTLPIQGRRVSIDGDDTIARSPIALPQLAAAPFPAIHVRSDTKFIPLPPLPPRARLCNHRSVLLNRWNIEEHMRLIRGSNSGGKRDQRESGSENPCTSRPTNLSLDLPPPFAASTVGIENFNAFSRDTMSVTQAIRRGNRLTGPAHAAVRFGPTGDNPTVVPKNPARPFSRLNIQSLLSAAGRPPHPLNGGGPPPTLNLEMVQTDADGRVNWDFAPHSRERMNTSTAGFGGLPTRREPWGPAETQDDSSTNQLPTWGSTVRTQLEKSEETKPPPE
ncbi:hypothetical protein BLNAU_19469 [Blattamonas nauphoetae]|uniref:Uncharacterized protein n=1 Tax=Blattamonas nauphoetae TaxID=2049346 RepID=A0ABQ9X1F1_9EUKA|nr:hypothetical protein BLNAU_19469 [Blattamonas nauphoetae]